MTTTEESVRKDFRKPLEKIACRAYLGTDQNDMTQDSWNKINFNSVTYDLGQNFDRTTNYHFDVPVTGLYSIKLAARLKGLTVIADKTYYVGIFVNDVNVSVANFQASGTGELSLVLGDDIYLNKNDYVDFQIYPASVGVNTIDIQGGSTCTFVAIRLATKEGARQ